MHRDPPAAVRRVARFVGGDARARDDALVARVVAASSMDAMKAGAGAINVRSGGSGKWRKMIAPGGELDRLFDDVYRQQMSAQDDWPPIAGGERLTFDFGDGVVM